MRSFRELFSELDKMRLQNEALKGEVEEVRKQTSQFRADREALNELKVEFF